VWQYLLHLTNVPACCLQHKVAAQDIVILHRQVGLRPAACKAFNGGPCTLPEQPWLHQCLHQTRLMLIARWLHHSVSFFPSAAGNKHGGT
jgi:hypothetical protein